MKNIFVFIAVVTFLYSCAQKKIGKSDEKEILNSKYLKIIGDTNTLVMIENLVVNYGDLYAEADSAFLQKKLNTITLYGIRTMKFNGEPVSINKTDIIRYKKGSPDFLLNPNNND